MQFPPVKEAALEHGIEVYQPRRVREPECVEYLRSFDADIIVVVAFGQILPKEILEMPKYGCVNVHASLLPKYRGECRQDQSDGGQRCIIHYPSGRDGN